MKRLSVIMIIIISIIFSGCLQRSHPSFDDYRITGVDYSIELRYNEIISLNVTLLNEFFIQHGYNDINITISYHENIKLIRGNGTKNVDGGKRISIVFYPVCTQVADIENKTDCYGKPIEPRSPIFYGQYGPFWYNYYICGSPTFDPPLEKRTEKEYTDRSNMVKEETKQLVNDLNLTVECEWASSSSTGGT